MNIKIRHALPLVSLLLAFACGEALAAKQLWKAVDSINTPESAYFEPGTGKIFVSNVVGGAGDKDGKGWISMLDSSGKVIQGKWVDGIDAPKGLRANGPDLWVSNIDEMVHIDIPSGKIKERIAVPGSKFLNDDAISPDGTVWVSDTMTSAIYEIKNGKATLVVQGDEWECPNGLLWLKGDRLVVAGWGTGIAPDFSTKTPGHLYILDLKTKKKTLITAEALGHLDGLESDGHDGYLVSDWMAGKVFHVNAHGVAKEILSGFKHAADIGYIPSRKILLVPDMGANSVTAYGGI